jgi:tetratricopeptide (TPR) repeat protein
MKKTLLGFFTSLFNSQTAEKKYKEEDDKDELEEHRTAIADHTKAIELNPNDSEAYNNRGDAKNDLEDYKGAIVDYTKAIELNTNYSEAYNSRGTAKA